MSTLASHHRAAIELILRRRGHDFGDLREDLVRRCMDAHAGLETNPDAWLVRLERDDVALDRLVSRLFCSVTSFFRDQRVFEALARHVLPEVVESISLGNQFRAWVIGAATGEEAWSVAMILDRAVSPLPWEVLATDIDERALSHAARARYTNVDPIPQSFRESYVVAASDGGFGLSADFRRNVRFIQHNFVGLTLAPTEAIVPTFPLVTCRNVLLHFDPRLQEKAWGRLVRVLHPRGALVVGPSDPLPPAESGLVPWPGLPVRMGIFRIGAAT